MRSSKHICVLEDESIMRNLLKRLLARDYAVSFVNSGHELTAEIANQNVDLVLLDIRLPGEDGMAIAKTIRARSNIPIVLISGLSSPSIIAMGLNIGGDDYVTKPFDSDVLLARIRNVIKRFEHSDSGWTRNVSRTIEFQDCVLDLYQGTVTNEKGEVVILTERESQTLAVLIRADARIVPRDELYRIITGRDFTPSTRVLDVHISHIRQKLRSVSSSPEIIASHRGIGYSIPKTDKRECGPKKPVSCPGLGGGSTTAQFNSGACE